MPEFINLKERRKIESYLKIGEDIILAEISINRGKCKGCGSCIETCVARSIELVDKKARLVTSETPLCVGCGDCAAMCPEDAIRITKFFELTKSYRFLDRGKPKWPRKF